MTRNYQFTLGNQHQIDYFSEGGKIAVIGPPSTAKTKFINDLLNQLRPNEEVKTNFKMTPILKLRGSKLWKFKRINVKNIMPDDFCLIDGKDKDLYEKRNNKAIFSISILDKWCKDKITMIMDIDNIDTGYLHSSMGAIINIDAKTNKGYIKKNKYGVFKQEFDL